MIVRFAVAAILAASVAVVAMAQSDSIATRKAAMKEVGGKTREGAAIAKGEAPFDAAKVQAIFATYADAASKLPGIFPDNSKTGGETAAAPKIWEDKAGFQAKAAKFAADAKAAQTAVKDLDSFKASFGEVTKNCGGCHETYRLKKS